MEQRKKIEYSWACNFFEPVKVSGGVEIYA